MMVVGTFLPWLRSGSRNRSSYTIFDLVERLGFTPGGVVSWSLRLWPLVPLLLVGVTVLGWAFATRRGRWWVVIVAAGLAVVWVGGTAMAILLAPDGGLFRLGPGPAVTVLGALPLVAGVFALRNPGSAVSGAS